MPTGSLIGLAAVPVMAIIWFCIVGKIGFPAFTATCAGLQDAKWWKEGKALKNAYTL